MVLNPVLKGSRKRFAAFMRRTITLLSQFGKKEHMVAALFLLEKSLGGVGHPPNYFCRTINLFTKIPL